MEQPIPDPNRSLRGSTQRRCLLAAAAALGVATFAGHSQTAQAKDKVEVGLGGGMGDPFGPSVKLFFNPQHALQFDLGWAPLHHGDGITHANYLFHFKPFVSKKILDFGMYIGGGAGVVFWADRGRRGCFDNNGNGNGNGNCNDYYYSHHYKHSLNGGGAAFMLRAPVGLYIHWGDIPIDTVVEGGWSPYVVHWDGFHGDFSIKVRYYFGR